MSLTLSANKSNAYPSETIQFSTVVTPEGEYDVEYRIVSGSELATIDQNGLLTINETATNGGTVIVESKVGDYVSNKVGVEVSIKVTSVTISSQKNSLLAGYSLPLSWVILPSNATDQNISWTFVEGEGLATISGNTFTVKEGVKSGSVIKVKATVNGVESNTLSFVVEKTQDELNKENLMLSLNNSFIQIDKYGTTTSKLTGTIYDGNFHEVSGKNLTFEIVEGSEYVTLSKSGNECSFVAVGHGVATVKVTIEGTEVSELANIQAIVPPTSLAIHEVFTQRPGYNYNYGRRDNLKFPVTPIGTNVCQDYTISFTGPKNETGSAVAEYNEQTGEITFNTTGLVTVTVTSKSGSKLEASTSYTFNVNDGINVHTFEELKELAFGRNAPYAGEIINVTVFEKPVGKYEYEYGYDLVPAVGLKAKSEQKIEDIYNHAANIVVYDRGIYLNGNNHSIDVSQVRVLTKSDIDNYRQGLSKNYKGWPVLYIYPDTDTDPDNESKLTHEVNIYDINFKGNCGISFGDGTRTGEDLNGSDPVSAYQSAIQIGSAKSYDRYYVDMENVTSTGFDMGVTFAHVIDGNVRNITVDNIFSNGIQVSASLITFTDLYLGRCGATGIEAGPDFSNAAGVNFDQTQKITLAGHIETTNYNAGNTVYMMNYNTGTAYTVAQIIGGVIANSFNTPEKLSNVTNAKQEFVFVSFIFHALESQTANQSVIQYKDIDGAGIIHASQITGVDYTHKYIEIDVAIQGMNLGKAILYNLNYGKQPQ